MAWDQPARSNPAWFPSPQVGFLSLQNRWCGLQSSHLAAALGLLDVEVALWVQGQEWSHIFADECSLPLSAGIEELV